MPILLVVADDFHLLKERLDTECADTLGGMIKHGRGLGFHIILAGSTSDLSSCWDDYLKALMDCRCGYILGSNSMDDLQVFDARRAPGEEEGTFPPGIGYLVRKGQLQRVKIATTQSNDFRYVEWSKKIMQLYGEGEA
jgi:uncharacterized protein YPO0396